MTNKTKELSDEIDRMLDVYEIYTIDIKDIDKKFEKDILNIRKTTRKEMIEEFEKIIDKLEKDVTDQEGYIEIWANKILDRIKQQLQELKEKK